MADNETKSAETKAAPKKVDPNATEKYRLLRGKHLGVDPVTGEDTVYKPGDDILLTKEQAKNFGDKVKSHRVLRAEAAAYAEDHVDSTVQPIAPFGPVDDGTNEPENEKDAESQAKQTTQPTGGDGTTQPPTGGGATNVAPTGAAKPAATK